MQKVIEGYNGNISVFSNKGEGNKIHCVFAETRYSKLNSEVWEMNENTMF